MNTYLPGLVAERYRHSRVVAFSTGNVYPLRSRMEGGAVESTPISPVGEYAQSALGRERTFEYGSARWGTLATILRLNYAVELRYGVPVDIGRAVFERRPVSLSVPLVNVIWQRDANAWCLRSFAHCPSPPFILNITGSKRFRCGTSRWNSANISELNRPSSPTKRGPRLCSATPARQQRSSAGRSVSIVSAFAGRRVRTGASG